MMELFAQTAASGGWESSMLLGVFLLCLGLVFIIAEVFFVSFGVLSLCSLASFIAAVTIAFNVGQVTGLVFILAIIVLMPVLIILALKVMPHTRWGSKLVQGGPQTSEVESTATEGGLDQLLGRKGRTLSVCRPAGMAEINKRRYDVVSEGLTIPDDAPVQVIEVEGNRIVVRELDVDDLERTK